MYDPQLDELLEYPTVEGTQTLIFNKITGAFIASMCGSHLDKVNTTYCKGKTAVFNPETHNWVGDYDTGSVKAKTDTPRLAYEHALDGTAAFQIRNKYDYHHQLNIIIDMIHFGPVGCSEDLAEREDDAERLDGERQRARRVRADGGGHRRLPLPRVRALSSFAALEPRVFDSRNTPALNVSTPSRRVSPRGIFRRPRAHRNNRRNNTKPSQKTPPPPSSSPRLVVQRRGKTTTETYIFFSFFSLCNPIERKDTLHGEDDDDDVFTI